jgi:uncharacterized protein (DUF3084 family)
MAFKDFAKKNSGFIILTGVVILGGTVAYAVYRSKRNKLIISKIEEVINKNVTFSEALGKAVKSEVFKGNDYQSYLKSKGVGGYIVLQKQSAEKYADSLYNAMKGGLTGAGTDEEAIEKVFVDLRDQVAVSQVFQAYKDKFKRDLQTDLTDELSQYYQWRNYDIILAKPQYRKPK